MRKYKILLLFIGIYAPLSAQTTVSGGNGSPYLYTPAPSTGIENVVLLNGVTNGQIECSTSTPTTIEWYRVDQNGTNTLIQTDRDASYARLTGIEDGFGYRIKQATKEQLYWIIDYTRYPTKINQLTMEDENSCTNVQLEAQIDAPELAYYTQTGAKLIVPRTYTLTYKTLEWNSEEKIYNTKQVTKNYTYPVTKSSLPTPLCDTEYTLKGDQIAQTFNSSSSSTTAYQAITVTANPEAQLITLNGDTEPPVPQGEILNGSAPFDVLFKSYANEPVTQYYEWQIATDSQFEQIMHRYPDQELRYSFAATNPTDPKKPYYVRLLVTGSSCTDSTAAFVIKVSESELKIPNAFSPNGDGINDEFKVSYKSLLTFNCSIFNRWGMQLHHFTDPDKGWDGMYNGKEVNTGVYFYNIEATGSDGITYSKKGAINILRSKRDEQQTPATNN